MASSRLQARIAGRASLLSPDALTRRQQVTGPVMATTSLAAFLAGRSRILLWEAFVSGIVKTTGLHHDDARLAVEAFAARWPEIETDVPAEPAVNHAAVAASVAGFRVDPAEFGAACVVVGVTPATLVDPTAA